MSEVEPPIVKEKIADQKPFVIRGHHLLHYAILVRRDVLGKEKLSPLEHTKAVKDSLEKEILEIRQNPNDVTNQKQEKYLQDMLGLSLNTERFNRLTLEIFKTFLMLPDNFPAEIVEGIPDTICRACEIGKHCRESGNKSNPTRDGDSPDEFLKDLNRLNLPKPIITQKKASFSNAKPLQVRTIRTTIGVVKEVLRRGASDLWRWWRE